MECTLHIGQNQSDKTCANISWTWTEALQCICERKAPSKTRRRCRATYFDHQSWRVDLELLAAVIRPPRTTILSLATRLSLSFRRRRRLASYSFGVKSSLMNVRWKPRSRFRRAIRGTRRRSSARWYERRQVILTGRSLSPRRPYRKQSVSSTLLTLSSNASFWMDFKSCFSFSDAVRALLPCNPSTMRLFFLLSDSRTCVQIPIFKVHRGRSRCPNAHWHFAAEN